MNRYNDKISSKTPKNTKNQIKLQKPAIVNKDANTPAKKKLCPERLITCFRNRIKKIVQQRIHPKRSKTKGINRNIDIPMELLVNPSAPKLDKKKTLNIRNRIEQLAYPPVRILMETKKKYKIFLKDKDEVFSRLLNESQSSYYSQLANIKPIEQPAKPPKWTDQEWKKHKRIAKKLAQPKKIVPPPPVEKVVKPFKDLEESIEKLSKPRSKVEAKRCISEWKLSDKLKYYEPSERIRELGKPVQRIVASNYKDPTKIEPAALNYNPTDRIVELAKERKYYDNVKEDPFGIQRNALRAQPSKRILELAKPKDKRVKLNKKSKKTKKTRPTHVSKPALTAVPTTRTLELAKPRFLY